MDDFLLRAGIAGAAAALVAGPLGCFVVWRRLSYFGATMAHAALLGVAFAFLFDWNVVVGITVVAVAAAGIVLLLERIPTLAGDTLLGFLAETTLALGLVVIGFLENVRVDLVGYLFGDILAVSSADIAWMYGGGAVVLAVLIGLWRPLLAATVEPDIARVEGVNVQAMRIVTVFLIAIVIAVAMKIVGILLTVALLIVPAAAARRLTATPETMALMAAAVGLVSVGGGLAGAMRWDLPAGPAIVLAAALIFALTSLRPLASQRSSWRAFSGRRAGG